MATRPAVASIGVAMKPTEAPHQIAQAILGFIGEVPTSSIAKSEQPEEAARQRAAKAAAMAAAAAGSLALPPGPFGWVTILPELIAVWKIQAQMVADIAALFGRKATLSQEQMLYCLFKHTVSQGLRDLVVRAGERFLVKRATGKVLQAAAQRIGMKVTQRAAAKGLARWLPVVGALGVGAYAYYDTAQVARSAIELFSGDIDFEPEAR